LEQFERTKRYLEKMRCIYSGIFSSSGHDKESYDDDVITFFIHCYHIRDWIIHLNKIGVTSKEVDDFINSHTSLKICADLSNGSKHCKLMRGLRTERQPHIVSKQHRTSTYFTGNGGGENMKSKYSILSNTNIYDALELAEKCVELWAQFINEMKTHNN